MAVAGWILDKSAAAHSGDEAIGPELDALAGDLKICSVGELEQLYSARSATSYVALKANCTAPSKSFRCLETSSNARSRCNTTSHITTACGTAQLCPTCSSRRRRCITALAWFTLTGTSNALPRFDH